jgi:hypothetical protein
VLSLFRYKNHFSQAEQNHKQAKEKLKVVLEMLAEEKEGEGDNESNMILLPSFLDQLIDHERAAEENYLALLESHSVSVPVLRGYANVMADIFQNDDEAELLFKKAADIEAGMTCPLKTLPASSLKEEKEQDFSSSSSAAAAASSSSPHLAGVGREERKEAREGLMLAELVEARKKLALIQKMIGSKKAFVEEEGDYDGKRRKAGKKDVWSYVLQYSLPTLMIFFLLFFPLLFSLSITHTKTTEGKVTVLDRYTHTSSHMMEMAYSAKLFHIHDFHLLPLDPSVYLPLPQVKEQLTSFVNNIHTEVMGWVVPGFESIQSKQLAEAGPEGEVEGGVDRSSYDTLYIGDFMEMDNTSTNIPSFFLIQEQAPDLSLYEQRLEMQLFLMAVSHFHPFLLLQVSLLLLFLLPPLLLLLLPLLLPPPPPLPPPPSHPSSATMLSSTVSRRR